MITNAKLLSLLHRHPLRSIATLFAIGMAVIFATMVFLTNRMNEDMALQYASTYILALDKVQSVYSAEIVGRLQGHGIKLSHDDQQQTIRCRAPIQRTPASSRMNFLVT